MPDQLIQVQSIVQIIIKIGAILISLFYILYSFVVIRQVQKMKQVVQVGDRGLLLGGAYVQLFIGLTLFAYSLLIL